MEQRRSQPGGALVKILFHTGDVQGQPWVWRDLAENITGGIVRVGDENI
jgi:hypothetical protein